MCSGIDPCTTGAVGDPATNLIQNYVDRTVWGSENKEDATPDPASHPIDLWEAMLGNGIVLLAIFTANSRQ